MSIKLHRPDWTESQKAEKIERLEKDIESVKRDIRNSKFAGESIVELEGEVHHLNKALAKLTGKVPVWDTWKLEEQDGDSAIISNSYGERFYLQRDIEGQWSWLHKLPWNKKHTIAELHAMKPDKAFMNECARYQAIQIYEVMEHLLS